MTGQPSTATVQPECQVGEHSWCRTGEVRVGRTLVFPAKRCDCRCHAKEVRAR